MLFRKRVHSFLKEGARVLTVKLDGMKRRVMVGMTYNEEPKLVKLTDNPGVTQNYTIENGYLYFDLLVVGGGGAGGINSGGGGGSGAIVYVKNFNIKKLRSKSVTYKIANQVTSDNDGDNTLFSFDSAQINCTGGKRGSVSGFTKPQSSYGDGAQLPDIYSILSSYTDNPSANIAVCSNGGGAAGYHVSNIGYGGGSGASMSGNGKNNSGQSGGTNISNNDGTGGYNGGNSGSGRGGYGYKLNNVSIPIVSVFQGGGKSGKSANGIGHNGSGRGGGAAAYGSGGNGGYADSGKAGTDGGYGAGGGGGGGGYAPDGGLAKGGNGGQGIICLYYHN